MQTSFYALTFVYATKYNVPDYMESRKADSVTWRKYRVAVSRTGILYLARNDMHTVYKVDEIGFITTVAGISGSGGYSGDGGVPQQAELSSPRGLAVGHDGSLYIADSANNRVRRVMESLPGFSLDTIAIASKDGAQLYVFSSQGVHLRTINALTNANLYEFGYNGASLLVTIRDHDDKVTTIERDEDGNPTAFVAPHGQRTELTLDANGFVSGITNPAGEVHAFEYTSDGLLTRIQKPRGNFTDIEYDAQGRLQQDSNQLGGYIRLESDETTDSLTTTKTTAEGRVSIYKMSSLPTGNRLRTNTFPSGLQFTKEFGKDGNHTELYADGMEVTQLWGADPAWGLMTPLLKEKVTTTPAGLVFTRSFERQTVLSDPADPLSLVSRNDTVTVNGRAWKTSFDAGALLWTSESPQGRLRYRTIDTRGRTVAYEVPNLAPTSFTYDGRGFLRTVTQGTGPVARMYSLGYNNSGYMDSMTDTLMRVTRFTYDGAGRVLRQTLPDGREVGMAFDENGNLTAVTPPGRAAHEFSYTVVDLNEYYIPPDIGFSPRATQYSYTLDKQLDLVIRPDGLAIDYDYDDAGRLWKITTPRGVTMYAYDPQTGHVATMSTPDGVGLAYGFDGSLLTDVTWSGPVSGSVQASYDDNFRIISRSINDSHAISFAYDDDGLSTGAGDIQLARDVDNGFLMGSALGAIMDSHDYNAFGEPISYHAYISDAASDVPLFTTTYTRDKLGRITAKSESILIDRVQQTYEIHSYDYSYDLAGRLEQVYQDGELKSQYVYDENGNRLFVRDNDGFDVAGGLYDGQDRLTSYDDMRTGESFEYAYTANGELYTKTDINSGEITVYDYDVFGNLRSVTLPDGRQIEYIIDGQNRRVGKKVDGVLQYGLLYKDPLNPITELDASGQVVSRFVYGTKVNVPDYMIKNGKKYRIICDHLGSVRLVITMDTGEIAQRIDYDEFGRVLHDTNPGFQPFGFAGGIYEPLTGLVRFGARDYDAETGRWTAKDLVRFKGGNPNLYGHVLNDPINLIDISGLANVYNGTNRTIWIVSEDGQPQALAPGESALADGIYNTPGQPFTDAPPDGTVRKFIDLGDVHIIENADGTLSWGHSDVISMLADIIHPDTDWKTSDWMSQEKWPKCP